jgi:hypothetical protein
MTTTYVCFICNLQYPYNYAIDHDNFVLQENIILLTWATLTGRGI